jgi:anaerobic selenocysteine-containing dehydrogenase
VAPPADGRDDYAILYELGMRVGGMRMGHPVVDQIARTAWKLGWSLPQERILDFALRIGPYGDKFFLPRGLSLKKVRAAPHGIDLGPMVPSAKERVRTPDGRVDLAPALLVAEVPRVETWVDRERTRRSDALVLIGRRHLRTNNSWMHNARSLVKGPDRATLLVHVDDAARLKLTAGQEVRVTSRVGSVVARVAPTSDIMPGVVSLPHGYGHAAAKDTLKIAGATPGPNVNAITDDLYVEPLLGTAVLNGVPVTIEAISDRAAAAP